jgi:hypothetical protein
MADKKLCLMLQDFNQYWRNQAPAGHAYWQEQERQISVLLAAATPEDHTVLSTYPAYAHFYKEQPPVVVTPEAKTELDTILGAPVPVLATEIPQQTGTEVAVAEVISDEEFLSRNLIALKQTLPEELSAKLEEYKAITIAGTSDKAGYKKAKEAWKQLKDARIAIEKKRKELKEPAITYGKNIENIAKELTAMVEPIEKDLNAKMKYIDETEEREALEASRLQREKERAEYEALQRKSAREQNLFGVGMYYNGQVYFSPTAPQLQPVTPEQINGLDDVSWNNLIAGIKQALAPPPPPPAPLPPVEPAPFVPTSQDQGFAIPAVPVQQAPPPQQNYFGIPYANNTPVPASAPAYEQPAQVPASVPPLYQPTSTPEPTFMRAETMQDAYNKGYEDAKAAAVHLLTYEPPCTRQDLIQKINNFQPLNQ